jgi:hypothetical protein
VVRQTGGLGQLVNIISRADIPADLLLAVTGAVWKLSLSPENVAGFQKLGIIPILVNLLRDQPEKVILLMSTSFEQSSFAL